MPNPVQKRHAAKGDVMSISLNAVGLQSPTSTSTVSGSTNATPAVQDRAAIGDATSVDVSKPGQLMAALKKLKDENPDQFKAVVSNLAQEVRDQAQGASGHEQKFLNHFADTLDKVASTQDLSALQPPEKGGHARGAKGYPPPPPPESGEGDGDRDDQTSAASSTSAASQANRREKMDALLASAIKEVNAALGSNASASTGA
jgi:hypothetical protein